MGCLWRKCSIFASNIEVNEAPVPPLKGRKQTITRAKLLKLRTENFVKFGGK